VEFSRVLNQQMDYFSSNPSADSIERVKGEIAQVKSGLVDNIDKVRTQPPFWRMRACVRTSFCQRLLHGCFEWLIMRPAPPQQRCGCCS